MNNSLGRRLSPHIVAAILGFAILGIVAYTSGRGAVSGGRSNHGEVASPGGHASGPPLHKGRNQVFSESVTWAQARQRCADLGGHLATIGSKEENALIASLLPSAGEQVSFYWIGLTDERDEGRWRWVTGESLGDPSWNEGEPNNYGGNEDYAAIAASKVRRELGRWNDFDGPNRVHDEVKGFVCEWPGLKPTAPTRPIAGATFQGRRYSFFRENVSWFWASRRCEEMGGHLVTITSKEENEFVATLIPRARDYDTYFWIGLTDESKERVWTWITGEPVVFQNWRTGEPNDAGGNEDYAAISASPAAVTNGTWNDFEGPHRFHEPIVGFVCEWEADAAIEPPEAPEASFGGHRYAVFHEQVTWAQAKARCESMGGRLATFESEAEIEFITSQLVKPPPRPAAYWIGLTDESNEGEWRWVGGAKAVIEYWLKGEPNDYRGNEDYGALLASPDKASHGRWNDLEGPNLVHEMVVGFICEWEP